MPSLPVQLIRFYAENASEQDWEDRITGSILYQQEIFPDQPPVSREYIRKRIEQSYQNPDLERFTLLARVDSQFAGMFGASFLQPSNPDYEKDKHVAHTVLYVLPEFRRRGIATAFLEQVVDTCLRRGVTVLQTETTIEAGRAFAGFVGMETALEIKVSRLMMNEIDWEMVNQWAREGEQRSPDAVLEVFTGLPAVDLAALGELYTGLFADIPFENMEAGAFTATPAWLERVHQQAIEAGDTWITMLTIEPDGTLSGMTECLYSPSQPELIEQRLTGISPRFRDRGLGKWLKAAMLLYLHKHYPQVEMIDTGNANVNAPMLAINDRLGFRLHQQVEIYKINVAELAAHLGL